MQAHPQVPPHTLFTDHPGRHREQLFSQINTVGGDDLGHRNRSTVSPRLPIRRTHHVDQRPVRDPRAVEASGHLGQLVLVHALTLMRLRHRQMRRLNHSRTQPTQRLGATPVTRAHQQVRKRPDKRRIRPNLVPLRNRKPFTQTKVRHQRTHVIPAPGSQPNHVITQFVQDFVHLERRRHRLDQHRRPNRPPIKPQPVLRALKQAVPQPSLIPVFDLGEVEVRPVIALE